MGLWGTSEFPSAQGFCDFMMHPRCYLSLLPEVTGFPELTDGGRGTLVTPCWHHCLAQTAKSTGLYLHPTSALPPAQIQPADQLGGEELESADSQWVLLQRGAGGRG